MEGSTSGTYGVFICNQHNVDVTAGLEVHIQRGSPVSLNNNTHSDPSTRCGLQRRFSGWFSDKCCRENFSGVTRGNRSQLCRRACTVPTRTCLCIRHKRTCETVLRQELVCPTCHKRTSETLFGRERACAFAPSACVKHTSDGNLLVQLATRSV